MSVQFPESLKRVAAPSIQCNCVGGKHAPTSAICPVTMQKEADHYRTIGWSRMEFEEQAYARTLVRNGYLTFAEMGR